MLLESNRFYQARLHPVRTWNDFQRLPLTTKEEITADQQANPPFGTNLTFPIDRYSRLHQTSGTSGSRPLRWLDTPESWEWWVRIWAEHIYRAAGARADDRIFFAFSFGPFIGFWSAFSGAERVGALVIPGGAMTTNLFRIGPDQSVEDALAMFKTREDPPDFAYYFFVTDSANTLIGVLSLRQVLIAHEGARVREVMTREPMTVVPEAEAQEVAEAIAEYNLLAIPVVDEHLRFLGAITVDDVLDRLLKESWRRGRSRSFGG